MTLPRIHTHPSPNANARAPGKIIAYVILHYTGMPTAVAALQRLCDPAAQVSAHYVIDRDGKTWQLVDETQRAWHAGVSCWRGEQNMNSVSIGVELVNRGHQGGYQTFPAPQIAACIGLLSDLRQRHGIRPENILAHSDIAPQRKEDPGELFPWQELAQAGVAYWPGFPPPQGTLLPTAEVRALLRQIGYDCPAAGDYDPALRRVLLAFQRHWQGRHLSGIADAPTVSKLLRLAGSA